MKIWILSSDSEIASTKSLVTALQNSHHETEVLNPISLHFEFGRKGLQIFQAGKKLSLPDLILPRLGWQSLSYGLRLCRALEISETRILNSPESFEKSSDKLLSLQILSLHQIPVPQTRFSPLTLKSEWQIFKNSDAHVFKTLQGSQGFGVTWQNQRSQSLAQVDAYRTVQSPFLVQELIKESQGEDVRAFVINGEIVASMKRRAPRGELRSNLHQGGKAVRTELSKKEKQLVLQTAEVLGLYYAGIDFLRSQKGPLILEANASPGFEGISQASKQDIAAVFAESLER